MTLFLVERAAGESSGLYLICLLIGALVLTWPIYRRILRWLGTLFFVFGMVLAVAALGAPLDTHTAGLLAGGLALRLVGGFRPLKAVKCLTAQGDPAQQPAVRRRLALAAAVERCQGRSVGPVAHVKSDSACMGEMAAGKREIAVR